MEESEATGDPVRAVLHHKAEELGEQLGRDASEGIVETLEQHGFEPRREGDAIDLANCPFQARPGSTLRPSAA